MISHRRLVVANQMFPTFFMHAQMNNALRVSGLGLLSLKETSPNRCKHGSFIYPESFPIEADNALTQVLWHQLLQVRKCSQHQTVLSLIPLY